MDGSVAGGAEKRDIGQSCTPLAEPQRPKVVTLEHLVGAGAEDGLWDKATNLTRRSSSRLVELLELPSSECGMAFATAMQTVDEPPLEDVALVRLRRFGCVVLRPNAFSDRSDRRHQIVDYDRGIRVPLPYLFGAAPCVGHPFGRG